MKTTGMFCYGGGFSQGVNKVFRVDVQLLQTPLGVQSANRFTPIEIDMGLDFDISTGDFLFGCPQKEYELDSFLEMSKRFKVVIFEVQPEFDLWGLKTYFEWVSRTATVKLNVCSFGNAQNRKREFFIAYKGTNNFNILPPEVSSHYPLVYDKVYDVRNNKAESKGYHENTYRELSSDRLRLLKHLPNGWKLDYLHKYGNVEVSPYLQNIDTSDDLERINWLRPMVPITKNIIYKIHPDKDRPLTLGEVTTLMGWDKIPVGGEPFLQLAQGIEPCVGEWLAKQVKLHFENYWTVQDWESTYNHETGVWDGEVIEGKQHKTFDLTQYYGRLFDSSLWEKLKCGELTT